MKKSLIDNPRPGDFRAVCKKPRWLTADELPAGVDLSKVVSRLDRKRGEVVYGVPCTLDTTDRATFEQHMLEVHEVNLTRELNHHRGYAALSDKPWKAPRLAENGRPWTDKEGRTVTCHVCGLVIEVSVGAAATLRDHLADCE